MHIGISFYHYIQIALTSVVDECVICLERAALSLCFFCGSLSFPTEVSSKLSLLSSHKRSHAHENTQFFLLWKVLQPSRPQKKKKKTQAADAHLNGSSRQVSTP